MIDQYGEQLMKTIVEFLRDGTFNEIKKGFTYGMRFEVDEFVIYC